MPRRPPLDDTPTRDIGRYRLAHRIAVGGMAEVYRALWPQRAGGDRAVVIKRLLPALLGDPEQRAMFDHEADLGRRIDHPNVVAMIDHGLDEGTPYIVLEYVFGVDLWRLTRWLTRNGRTLRVPLAVWIGTEMLAGLAAVHAVRDAEGAPLHVVHRDVSPSNIFLSVHGDVKLGDLGIARAALYETAQRRGAGFRAKGKLGYLPPEQVAGRTVDQRGDVFAAAVVIAELLMGRPLFGGGTEIGVLLAIRDGDVRPFRATASRLPAGLADAILDGLERVPEHRAPSAGALRDALWPHVTESIEHLRAELGGLVAAAMDDAGETADRTSLAATIEKDARFVETKTPAPESELADEGAAYRVEHEGAALGSFTLADLVRAITTGEVAATDRVQVAGRDARVIANVAELARHLPPSTRTPTARRRTQMAQTSELYDVGARSMLAVLIDVLMARDDGLLLCERRGVRKEIYLEKGVPTFVTSNQPGELLGEMLVKKGVIDRAELDMALALMPRFEGRLGETLVALGLVEPIHLFRHITEQVRNKLLELFLWTDGHAALYRGVERPERGFPLRLDPWDVLVSGAVRRIDAGLEATRFAGRESEVLEQTGFDLESVHLPDCLAMAWTTCHAPRSLAELEGIGPSARDVRASALVLLEVGALRWRGRGGRA